MKGETAPIRTGKRNPKFMQKIQDWWDETVKGKEKEKGSDTRSIIINYEMPYDEEEGKDKGKDKGYKGYKGYKKDKGKDKTKYMDAQQEEFHYEPMVYQPFNVESEFTYMMNSNKGMQKGMMGNPYSMMMNKPKASGMNYGIAHTPVLTKVVTVTQTLQADSPIHIMKNPLRVFVPETQKFFDVSKNPPQPVHMKPTIPAQMPASGAIMPQNNIVAAIPQNNMVATVPQNNIVATIPQNIQSGVNTDSGAASRDTNLFFVFMVDQEKANSIQEIAQQPQKTQNSESSMNRIKETILSNLETDMPTIVIMDPTLSG